MIFILMAVTVIAMIAYTVLRVNPKQLRLFDGIFLLAGCYILYQCIMTLLIKGIITI